MSQIQKALVLGSSALGFLACTASTIRAVAVGTLDYSDLSQSMFYHSLWANIEPDAAIISACLPFLANIFGRKIFNAVKAVPAVGRRVPEILQCEKAERHGKDVADAAPWTQRAAHEAYDLDENYNIPVPAALERSDETGSFQHLVLVFSDDSE
ncbi:MAG: hypothetical protein Q9225_000733 [Loekoesia sp. 1 TL-2023]